MCREWEWALLDDCGGGGCCGCAELMGLEGCAAGDGFVCWLHAMCGYMAAWLRGCGVAVCVGVYGCAYAWVCGYARAWLWA